MDQDNQRMKFSALNVDFSSLCADPLGSRSLQNDKQLKHMRWNNVYVVDFLG